MEKRRRSMVTSEKVEEAIRDSTPRRPLPKLRNVPNARTDRAPVRNAQTEGTPVRRRKPLFTIEQILAWADAWKERTGRWPHAKSGIIPEAPAESWSKVNGALYKGHRGLPGNSSLALLLFTVRGALNTQNITKLSIPEILAWADAWKERNGCWPTRISGSVYERSEVTWDMVYDALSLGLRGLPGGSSLAQLLAEQRGARNPAALPRLTLPEIRQWAENHYARTGKWPTQSSGAPPEAPDESWKAIAESLSEGFRGLPGGSSLAELLGKPPRPHNERSKIRISVEDILEWADDHYRNTGKWPTTRSGPVTAMPGETWENLVAALLRGNRGLLGGATLAGLLEQHRGVPRNLPPTTLTQEQILHWADGWYERNGRGPTLRDGQIPEQPSLTWSMIHSALRTGKYGLSGGATLTRFLKEQRDYSSQTALPKLTEKQILQWAVDHYQTTGRWPNLDSGRIAGPSNESWRTLDSALKDGRRGLPGGSSLSLLLAQYRGVVRRQDRPKLTEEQILHWADCWHERTGKWPDQESGQIPEAEGSNWTAIDASLRRGTRGLPGGCSLAMLLSEHRSVRYRCQLPPLTEDQILAWAHDYHQRTGVRPNSSAGPIPDANGETWATVVYALRTGTRGLPEHKSLSQLLLRARGIDRLGRAGGLTEDQIRVWAEAYLQRTGLWPSRSKPDVVPESPGDTWRALDNALRYGKRGLPGGSSLVKLKEIQ